MVALETEPTVPGRQSDASPEVAAPSALNGANGSTAAASPAEESIVVARTEQRRLRRAARGKPARRPRAQQAGSGDAVAADSTVPAPDGADDAPADGPADVPAMAAMPTDQPAIAFVDSGKRGARTVRRASKKQHAAAAAVNASADNPALGALNRHLNTMTQQLTTAHRVIGRVAAERDALRQQLADLQGIPVEEIVVSTIGASSEPSAQPAKSSSPTSPTEQSRLARLNYFGVDDFEVMKRRRQGFAIVLLVVVVAVWVASRTGAIQLSGDFSRESLGQIPYVGDLVTLFLAGWILFRVVKVSSKGVRWVFPSEDQRRRRR